jgi:Protein of unknown function (DUF2804)
MRTLLSPPPALTDPATHAPSFGSYRGDLPRVDLAPLPSGRIASFLHRKRWVFTGVASGELFIACTIVHLGYLANAFFFAFDRAKGRMLVDRSMLTLPILASVDDNLGQGGGARFDAPLARTHLRLTSPPETTAATLTIRAPGVSIHARLGASSAPPAIGAVVKFPGPPEGLVQVTQKRVLLAVTGEATFDGATRAIDGGLGGIDASSGYLPRRTAWRWAFALGRAKSGERVALNLVEGFVGEAECALWLDGAIFPLAEGRFSFDASRSLEPWSVRTADGRVDLRFTPGAAHAEDRDLGLVASSYVQPVGTFSGSIQVEGRPPLEIDQVLGVVEDQRVVW